MGLARALPTGRRSARKMPLPMGPGFWYISFQAVSPRGRFAMLRTDPNAPLMLDPSTAVRPSLHLLRLCFPGILFVSCALFGATKCSAQDVAEAARQERTHKESKQKKINNVYHAPELKPH